MKVTETSVTIELPRSEAVLLLRSLGVFDKMLTQHSGHGFNVNERSGMQKIERELTAVLVPKYPYSV